jgi:adenylyltransferase/sulfurtransferase
MKDMSERYSRQEILELIGKSGQRKLHKSNVVIVGIGAIGSLAAELLVRVGVGTIKIIDRDIIELNNLQRQLLFDEHDVGKPKATAAVEKLKRVNSDIKITALNEDVDYSNINAIIRRPDCILDCTDNMETRFLINEYCIKERIPWVHAAAIKNYGTVFPIIPGNACFGCVFKETDNLASCDTAGILNTTSAVIAAIQVTEVIKILLGRPTINKLFHYDVWKNSFYDLKVKKLPCSACKRNFNHLNGKNASRLIKFCGSGYYQIRGIFTIKVIKVSFTSTAREFLYF